MQEKTTTDHNRKGLTNLNINEHTQLKTLKDTLFTPASSWQEEVTLVFCLFLKIGTSNVLELLPQVLSNVFIGHLSLQNANSSILLSGCGLSLTFLNITGVAISFGFTSPLYTLIPQCLGAHKSELLSVYLQRSFCILSLVLIISTVLQFFAGDIMKYIFNYNNVNDNNIFIIIRIYCRCLIPYLYLMGYFVICQRISQSLKLNIYLFYIVLIGACLTIPSNLFFVYYINLNFIGTAFTINIMMFICVVTAIILLIYKHYKYIFYPFVSLKVIFDWKGIKEYLSLSIPGLLQSGMSFWIAELITILSGYIANPSISISSTVICNNINLLITMLSVGISNAINIRLGKYIGLGGIDAIRKSKRLLLCGFMLDIIVLLLISTILIIFCKDIVLLWTDDPNIFQITKRLIIFGVIPRCVSFNFYIILGGIFRGLGRPTITAIIISISHLCIALPLNLMLLFYFNLRKYTYYGVCTIWLCTSFGYLFGSIIITLILIFKVDFKNVVNESQQRINQSLTTMKLYGATNNKENNT